MVKRYKVTCLNCKDSDVITVDDNLGGSGQRAVVDYVKKLKTPFRSFRWRPDLKWGFYCKCQNDNRLAPQEEADFDNLVDGDPISLERIAASLKIPDEKQFSMEEA